MPNGPNLQPPEKHQRAPCVRAILGTAFPGLNEKCSKHHSSVTPSPPWRQVPRAWFRAVHGPDNAASRLAALVDQVAARDGQGPGAGGMARLALRARGEPAPPAQV